MSNNIKEILEMLNNVKDKKELEKKIEEISTENMSEEDINKIKDRVERLKKNYEDKSEDELLEEIEKLKETTDINKLKKTLLKNRKAVKQLYNMMDDTQKKRVEKILTMLKEK